VWSALSAKRLINLKNKEQEIQILIIAPELLLVIRPRLYEANASGMTHPLGPLFKSASIHFFQGTAEAIDTESHAIHARSTQSVAGLQQYAFDIDSLTSAAKLETHLKSLASLPPSKARDTVVVCGAGFTGL
ncbi:hypothetical protein BGZ61DRAFT_291310, partial [Ilyonectria robusta]|uniref:uncharacterized protein n=1 Tax=Ilyonectria robusta TaxID=1079257 RepID=UPI001E8E16CE